MGSKTKTVSDFHFSTLLPEEANAYQQEILRILNRNGMLIEPSLILKAMINDVMFQFNEKVFERFGQIAEIPMVVNKVSNELIYTIIQDRIDDNIKDVDENTTYDDVIDWTYSGSSQIIKVVAGIDLDEDSSNEKVFTKHNDTLDIDISYTTPSYILDNQRWFIDGDEEPTVNYEEDNSYVTLVQIDENGNELEDPLTGEKITRDYDIPYDDRAVVSIAYYDNNDERHGLYMFDEELLETFEDSTALFVIVKKDGEFLDDLYTKFTLSRFGLQGKTDGEGLEDSLAQDEIKHAFITYSVPDEGEYKSLIRTLYGDIDNGKVNNVVIENDGLKIEYRTNGDGSFSVIFNGKAKEYPLKDENGNLEPCFIIPVNYLRRLPLRKKFQAFQDSFSIVVYAEEEIKLKWYQTGFFKWVTAIIAVGLAFYTGGASLALLTAGTIALSYALADIAPELQIIVGVATAIMTLGTSSLSTLSGVVTTVSKLAQLGSQLYNLYVVDSIKDMEAELLKINKERAEILEQLEEMKNNYLYNPIDFDTMYDSSFALMYNSYDIVYDYDRFYDLGGKDGF